MKKNNSGKNFLRRSEIYSSSWRLAVGAGGRNIGFYEITDCSCTPRRSGSRLVILRAEKLVRNELYFRLTIQWNPHQNCDIGIGDFQKSRQVPARGDILC